MRHKHNSEKLEKYFKIPKREVNDNGNWLESKTELFIMKNGEVIRCEIWIISSYYNGYKIKSIMYDGDTETVVLSTNENLFENKLFNDIAMDIVFKHLKELFKQSDLKDVIGRFYGLLSGKFVDRFLEEHIIIKTLECKSKEEFSNSYKTMNNNFIVAIIDKQKNILNNILQDDYFKGPPTVNITNNGNTIPWNPDISGIEMDRVTQENKVTDYDLKDSNGNRIVQVQRKGNEILVSKINTKTHAIEITATPIKQDNTNPVDMKKFSEEEYNNMAIRVSAINLMRYADINHIDNIKSLNYMTIYKAKDYVLSHINTELINNIEVEVDSILCPGDANVRPALSCFLSKYDKNIVICPRPSGNDINIVYITFKNGNKFIIVIVGNKHRSVIVDASTNMPDIIDKVIKAMRTLNYKDLFKEKQVKSFKNLWGLISDD